MERCMWSPGEWSKAHTQLVTDSGRQGSCFFLWDLKSEQIVVFQGDNRTVGLGRRVFKMERSQSCLLEKNDKPSFKCSCGFRNSRKATERPIGWAVGVIITGRCQWRSLAVQKNGFKVESRWAFIGAHRGKGRKECKWLKAGRGIFSLVATDSRNQWTLLRVREGHGENPNLSAGLNLLCRSLNWQGKTSGVNKLENTWVTAKCPDPCSVRFAGRLITNNWLVTRLLPYQHFN